MAPRPQEQQPTVRWTKAAVVVATNHAVDDGMLRTVWARYGLGTIANWDRCGGHGDARGIIGNTRRLRRRGITSQGLHFPKDDFRDLRVGLLHLSRGMSPEPCCQRGNGTATWIGPIVSSDSMRRFVERASRPQCVAAGPGTGRTVRLVLGPAGE